MYVCKLLFLDRFRNTYRNCSKKKKDIRRGEGDRRWDSNFWRNPEQHTWHLKSASLVCELRCLFKSQFVENILGHNIQANCPRWHCEWSFKWVFIPNPWLHLGQPYRSWAPLCLSSLIAVTKEFGHRRWRNVFSLFSDSAGKNIRWTEAKTWS